MSKQPTKWKKGDLCTVDGEGDEVFRIRLAPCPRYPRSAYLENITGADGHLGHGRESVTRLTRLSEYERLKLARRHRRALRLLTLARQKAAHQ